MFFGQTANVTAEITEIAANIAEEQVDQTLRVKLQEVFKPRTGTLYSDRMAILPALDEIQLDDDRPTLIVLERPADKLPQDFVDWWNKQDLQNRVLVLTADPNAVATLRTSARRMRAIEKVEERIKAQHGAESPQMTELQGVKGREAAGFTSALRETFKTIVFPTGKALRKVDDFRMEFDRNDYSGEQQIVDTLTKRGKFVPTDQFDAQFDNVRQDAEEFLFDADAVQQSSLRRNAAVRPAWFWLPRGGLRPTYPHRRPARLLAREGRPCRQKMGAAHARHRSSGRFRAGPDGHRPVPDQRNAGRRRHRLFFGERAARPEDGAKA